MEQKDYLMREIEKMGAVLRTILNRITGTKGNFATTTETVFEKTSEALIQELEFDLSHFITLNKAETEYYLSHLKGLNTENLELLANLIYRIAIDNPDEKSLLLLNKALQIYNLCEIQDKTFSLNREQQIKAIQNALLTI